MNSVCWRISPLLLAFAAIGCGESVEDHLARARDEIGHQDFVAAKADIIAALRADPDNREALELLAGAQLRLNDPDGALVTIERLKKSGNRAASVTRLHAEALLLQGKPEQAIQALGNDRTPDAWRIRARAQQNANRPLEALSSYDQGVASGNDARLYADFIWFKLTANDLPQAKAILSKLQGFAPNAMETQLIAGDVAVRDGRLNAALSDYRRAAKDYPQRVQPLVSQAELFERMGKLKAAKSAIEAAEKIEAGNPVVTAVKLRIAAQQGDWRTVRLAIQGDEQTLDPLSTEGQLYAEALLRQGQPEQARTFLGRVLVMQPGNRKARRLLGEALLTVGDAGSAASVLAPLVNSLRVTPQELELAIKAGEAAQWPQAAEWKARLQSSAYQNAAKAIQAGDIAMQKSDWVSARNAYRNALALGDDPVVLANLAYANCKTGQFAGTVEMADRALALAPNDPAVMKTSALARIVTGGDRAEAVQLLREAQMRNSTDPETAVLLHRLGG